MRSKNSKQLTYWEERHLLWVKRMPCSVCDVAGPSDAHHIAQGQHWTAVALCKDCHQGSVNGWHGQRAIWNVKKMSEIDALAKTIMALSLEKVL